ncbi:MAG: site-specific integrase [Thermaerobacter sp.]|nr:site-specific integrase [Thermaerobacter sp.]
MHSHGTRATYQQQTLKFVNWAREEHGVTRLEVLDQRAPELARTWLQQHKDAGYSPYTLATQRSALRLFFGNRNLAQDVALPSRAREGITHSRGGAVRSGVGEFQKENWPELMRFEQAVGLRRSELRGIRVGDVHQTKGGVTVHAIGKGGKPRDVPVLPGREKDVLRLVEGRSPDERIFDRLPSHADFHAERRAYAQELYKHLSGRPLPPKEGRLRAGSYDSAAALKVSQALGHERIDVALSHYLR